MVHIKEMKSLEFLEMFNVDLTDEGLACLGELTNLKKLSIPVAWYVNPKDNKYWYADKGLAELAKLSKLEELFIGSSHITDAGMGHIAKLTNLKRLNADYHNVTDDGIKNLVNLEYLRIGNGVTNEGFKNLSNLIELDTRYNKLITNDVKEYLPNLIIHR